MLACPAVENSGCGEGLKMVRPEICSRHMLCQRSCRHLRWNSLRSVRVDWSGSAQGRSGNLMLFSLQSDRRLGLWAPN